MRTEVPWKMKLLADNFKPAVDHELAHYAKSCWDLECLSSVGWIECGGFASRASYDLESHAIASKTRFTADRQLESVRSEWFLEGKVNIGKMKGKSDKKRAKSIQANVGNMSQEELQRVKSTLENQGHISLEGVELDASILNVESNQKRIQETEIAFYFVNLYNRIITENDYKL